MGSSEKGKDQWHPHVRFVGGEGGAAWGEKKKGGEGEARKGGKNRPARKKNGARSQEGLTKKNPGNREKKGARVLPVPGRGRCRRARARQQYFLSAHKKRESAHNIENWQDLRKKKKPEGRWKESD